MTTLSQLRTGHPGSACIIAGDKNDLDISGILDFDSALNQIVKKPTRKESLLSVIITDLRKFYVEPQIVDPVPVDNPNKGVPSDHNGVLAVPLSTKNSVKSTTKELKYVRPMPESSILEFGQSVENVDWSLMLDGYSSSEMVDMFQKMTNALQHIHFPLKKISVSPYDKAWITEELKTLRRRRQRIYGKEGKSQNYLDIKKEFDSKQKVEVSRYIDKIKQEVLSGKRGSGYNAIRKLENREFEAKKGSEYFDIPECVDSNLDDQQGGSVDSGTAVPGTHKILRNISFLLF